MMTQQILLRTQKSIKMVLLGFFKWKIKSKFNYRKQKILFAFIRITRFWLLFCFFFLVALVLWFRKKSHNLNIFFQFWLSFNIQQSFFKDSWSIDYIISKQNFRKIQKQKISSFWKFLSFKESKKKKKILTFATLARKIKSRFWNSFFLNTRLRL